MTTCRMVSQTCYKQVPVTTCRMVVEPCVKRVCQTICETVTEPCVKIVPDDGLRDADGPVRSQGAATTSAVRSAETEDDLLPGDRPAPGDRLQDGLRAAGGLPAGARSRSA